MYICLTDDSSALWLTRTFFCSIAIFAQFSSHWWWVCMRTLSHTHTQSAKREKGGKKAMITLMLMLMLMQIQSLHCLRSIGFTYRVFNLMAFVIIPDEKKEKPKSEAQNIQKGSVLSENLRPNQGIIYMAMVRILWNPAFGKNWMFSHHFSSRHW